jgi:uncharacterized protein
MYDATQVENNARRTFEIHKLKSRLRNKHEYELTNSVESQEDELIGEYEGALKRTVECPQAKDQTLGLRRISVHTVEVSDEQMQERTIEFNVLGGLLEPCGLDPVTGWYRDGCCSTGPEDLGSHTICAVVTAEFLAHQKRIGNDLSTPMPQYRFPGLVPGDRWCVTARNWARAFNDGAAAHVVLASTNAKVLELVPIEALQQHAVDVPFDPSSIAEES